MRHRVKNFLIALALFLQLLVVSVFLFINSDVCYEIMPDGLFCSDETYDPAHMYKANHPETVYIKPGETKRIKLIITSFYDGLTPPPPDKLFIFGTDQGAAIAKGGNTLLLWADDQVVVSWDGVPFNHDNAYLTISATKEAKQPPPNDFKNGSEAGIIQYVHLQAVDAKEPGGFGISVFMDLQEE